MHPARIFTCLLQVSLMDEAGNTKDDLTLPKGTDDSDKLATQIQQDFDDGKELVVTVLKVSILFLQTILLHRAKARAVMQARRWALYANETVHHIPSL